MLEFGVLLFLGINIAIYYIALWFIVGLIASGIENPVLNALFKGVMCVLFCFALTRILVALSIFC